MEVQEKISWLSGPLLFEMTGAQQKDHPPPKARVHFPALPVASWATLKRAAAMLCPRNAEACLTLCFHAAKGSLHCSSDAAATGGPARWFWAPFAVHIACCQQPNAGLQAVVGAGLYLGVFCPGQCCWVSMLVLSWHWRLAGEIAAKWLASLHWLLVLTQSSLLVLVGPFPFLVGFVSIVTHVENLRGDGRGVPEVSSVCKWMFGKPWWLLCAVP